MIKYALFENNKIVKLLDDYFENSVEVDIDNIADGFDGYQYLKSFMQTEEYRQLELNEQRKWEIRERLSQLSQDFVQAMAGAYFEDFAQRQLEFQALHNELRVLEGKEPREYKTKMNNETEG